MHVKQTVKQELPRPTSYINPMSTYVHCLFTHCCIYQAVVQC